MREFEKKHRRTGRNITNCPKGRKVTYNVPLLEESWVGNVGEKAVFINQMK